MLEVYVRIGVKYGGFFKIFLDELNLVGYLRWVFVLDLDVVLVLIEGECFFGC